MKTDTRILIESIAETAAIMAAGLGLTLVFGAAVVWFVALLLGGC